MRSALVRLRSLIGVRWLERDTASREEVVSADIEPVETVGLAYPWHWLVIGAAVAVGIGVVAASQGAVAMPPWTVAEIVVSRIPGLDVAVDWPGSWETIIWDLRLPRVLLAGVVGASLALSGATYQGLFRNPLADPFLIGVASGAGLGATVVLLSGVTSEYLGVSVLPIAAFAGAIAAVAIAYTIASDSEGLPLTNLILAGVAVAALASAVTTLLMIRSDPDLRPVLSWLLGGFSSAEWEHTLLILPYLLPSALVALVYGRILNVLQLDEEYAKQLGVNVESTKLLLIVAATLSTAAAVSFSGLIGFVGLIAPHAVRLAWGVDYRFLVPMAAIVGAGFLIVADLAARTVASPTELPVGIVTAFVGAPFFLYLLRRRRRALG